MIFRPAEASKRIVDFYKNYLLTTFQTNLEIYNKQFKALLSESEILAKGPYINLSDSYKRNKTINELIADNILCLEMQNLDLLYPDRKLYKHQVDSIIKINSGNNLVISSGTGSGKTECFLIPILNSLLTEKVNGTLSPGVRALIIYPMNALVNDQIRRLRDILRETPEITFGRFTGETKDNHKEAINEYLARERSEPRNNELISREQMRKTPPNVLITNYAMLEYLMLRPDDNVFFNEPHNHSWKYIVLDEAHTYNGAKGIEVAMLMKRLHAKLDAKSIQYILTSATLGEKTENPAVVEFASSLCSTDFKEENVIRAETKTPQPFAEIVDNKMALYSSLAEGIRNNVPEENLCKILKDFSIVIEDESDIQEVIYNLILHDSFYYQLRNTLKTPKTLEETALELKVSEDELTDFIAVASNAVIEGDRIFEARYHLFIRGIEGTFITLSPSNKLFLTKRETYYENFNDKNVNSFKVFEITFCFNCNAIFIIGQIDDKEVLIQKSRYTDDFEPMIFLLNGNSDTDEENDDPNYYTVCSVCGVIQRTTALKDFPCSHDKKYRNQLLLVNNGNTTHKCPSCGVINHRRNIIIPFYLSNDTATAILATALYKELPEKQVTKKNEPYDDFFGEIGTKEIIQEKRLTKQFLSFSDSRQAAAFFAPYLSITYREILMKRIMSEVAIQNSEYFNHEGMSVIRFIRYIEDLMDQYKINDTDNRNKEAWIETLKEMVNFKARNSLQNLGILHFEADDISERGNEKLGLTKDEVNQLFKIMCTRFIRDGAISIPINLTKSDQKRITKSGLDLGYVKVKTSNPYQLSWLPVKETSIHTKYLTKICSVENPKVLLDNIWSHLLREDYLPYKGTTFKLNFEKLTVKVPKKLYICDKCKRVSPYNIRNFCLSGSCDGKLVDYNFDDKKQNPHYKNLYRELPIYDLLVKEHTAQLTSNHAYDYQNQFKDKLINVLSCSTTFEMGVDVGTLETIFLRNMPPSPANYIQRAGRAGRTTKSAAYALTFCQNNSHDLNYFREPLSMIKGVITPPHFTVSNPKICIRHIFASAFSFFWQKHREYYTKNIGDFYEKLGHLEFVKYLHSNPRELQIYLEKILPIDLIKLFQIKNFGWIELLSNESKDKPGILNIAISNYAQDLEELNKAYKKYDLLERKAESGTRGSLSYNKGAIDRSLRTLKEQKLIEFLSRYSLIPKYGFPIDSVELRSFGIGGATSNLRLNRDLINAISEYAPGSEVVADGKIITSRYVRVIKGYSWPKYKYIICDQCNTLNKEIWTDVSNKLDKCKQCGSDLTKIVKKKREFIIPKFGFIMDTIEPEPVGTEKPERTYRGSISYIGDGETIQNDTYEINKFEIKIGTSQNDSLLVLNESDFCICDDCGYGELSNTRSCAKDQEHKNSSGFTCSNKRLKNYALGHEFKTDVLLIKFIDINVSNHNEAWTILYAILEGLSKFLNIERKELSGCLDWFVNPNFKTGNYCFVLFDNTPGGAGYVRQMRQKESFLQVLNKAKRIVDNCTCGGETADSACYGCLCNYYNQKQHDILKRKYAIDFFNKLGLD